MEKPLIEDNNIEKSYEFITKIHKKIDEGVTLSEVWKVQEKNTSEIYILKKLKNVNLPYDILKTLDSKYLPKTKYTSVVNGYTYIIEELIVGHSLQEILDSGKVFTEHEVVEIGRDICCALRQLHSHDIIHRDLKPSNVMYCDDGSVKLIDFDAVRVYDKNKTTDTIYVGSQGYTPPEIHWGGQTDQRSDIYSLGATLRAIVPGGLNYKGKLIPVLARCTNFIPNERFHTVNELYIVLNGLIKSEKMVIPNNDASSLMESSERQITEQQDSQNSYNSEKDVEDNKEVQSKNKTSFWGCLGILLMIGILGVVLYFLSSVPRIATIIVLATIIIKALSK